MVLRFRNHFAIAVLGAAVSAATTPISTTDVTAGTPDRDTSTARPIAVIDRTDIAMSGLTNVRELLLSRAGFNSFGLHRPFFVGVERAAFLLDGRPVSGLDLPMLPLSAVERVEILDEGAARHGGHAVAGAVNIVLRRGYEGAEASAGGGRPKQTGGNSNHGSALWGGAVGRGHLTVGVDHIRRREVRDADREFSRAKWTPGGPFAGTRGVSIAGNTPGDRSQRSNPGDRPSARRLRREHLHRRSLPPRGQGLRFPFRRRQMAGHQPIQRLRPPPARKACFSLPTTRLATTRTSISMPVRRKRTQPFVTRPRSAPSSSLLPPISGTVCWRKTFQG